MLDLTHAWYVEQRFLSLIEVLKAKFLRLSRSVLGAFHPSRLVLRQLMFLIEPYRPSARAPARLSSSPGPIKNVIWFWLPRMNPLARKPSRAEKIKLVFVVDVVVVSIWMKSFAVGFPEIKSIKTENYFFTDSGLQSGLSKASLRNRRLRR